MSWGPVEDLAALFAPGMRHEQQRRREVELLREDEGTGAEGGEDRVDFANNTVVLRRRDS